MVLTAFMNITCYENVAIMNICRHLFDYILCKIELTHGALGEGIFRAHLLYVYCDISKMVQDNYLTLAPLGGGGAGPPCSFSQIAPEVLGISL